MDIDQNVNQIVQNIVAQITNRVQSQVTDIINQRVTEVINAIDCTPMLAEKLDQKLDAKLRQLPIDTKNIESQLKTRLDNLSTTLSNSVKGDSLKIVAEAVNNQLSRINFNEAYQTVILSAIKNGQVTFPAGSIAAEAIDFSGFSVTGDNISGGIIHNFGSTGIDDQATQCQLTVMDDVTVVENNLLTKDLTVKGTATIEGDLNVTGKIAESSPMFKQFVDSAVNNVRTSLDSTVFDSYANFVVDRIKQNGLDLDQIKVAGQEIVNGSRLGNFITFSNLQSLGTLHELQVSGESFLAETLYVSRTRVGVNTIEPTKALSVWDQEVELGFGKTATNAAIIETPRAQRLVLSANGKNNLVLATDGSVEVNKINIGTMSFAVAEVPPSNDQPKGSIVFNSNPTLGGPLGWVSLGDARWANFGIID